MSQISNPRALVGGFHAEVDTDALVRRINAAVTEMRDTQAAQISDLEEAVTHISDSVRHSATVVPDALGTAYALTEHVRTEFTAILRGQPMAAMEIGSGPDGGFAVPTQVDGTIMSLLRNSSPLRRMATVVSLGEGSGSWKKMIHRVGGGSRWAHELEERAETSTPKLGTVEIAPEEIYAIPEVTNHVIDDASFDLVNFLRDDVAAEFTLGETEAFVSGDGVKEPMGFLHKPTSNESDADRPFGTYQHVVTGVDSGFLADNDGGFQNNLIDLIFALPAPYRSGEGVGWMMNSLTASVVMKFKDGDGRLLWRDGLDIRESSRLLGYPVSIDENMPDIGSDALPIAFGNWRRGYAIVDHVGMKLIRDQVTKKGWTKFYFSKRTGGAPLDTNAIKFLKFSVA